MVVTLGRNVLEPCCPLVSLGRSLDPASAQVLRAPAGRAGPREIADAQREPKGKQKSREKHTHHPITPESTRAPRTQARDARPPGSPQKRFRNLCVIA